MRGFLTLCHHVARLAGGTVVDHVRAGVTPSFHAAVLRRPGHEDVALLRHAVLPMVAFARPAAPGDTTVAFVDDPGLAALAGRGSGLRVLTTDQLAAPLSVVDLTGLGADEHRQIAYWTPGTVGELLFNFWN